MRALGSEYLRSCFALKGIHNNSILLCSQILVWTSKLRYYLQSVHFYSGLWLIQEEHSPQHLYVHLVTHRKWTFKLVRIRHWQKNADLVVVLHIFDRCSDLVSLSIFITEVFLHEKLFFSSLRFELLVEGHPKIGIQIIEILFLEHSIFISSTFE